MSIKKKELFKPIDIKNIRMYACGPTVYENPHVGNARTLVVFDTLFRILKQYQIEMMSFSVSIHTFSANSNVCRLSNFQGHLCFCYTSLLKRTF